MDAVIPVGLQKEENSNTLCPTFRCEKPAVSSSTYPPLPIYLTMSSHPMSVEWIFHALLFHASALAPLSSPSDPTVHSLPLWCLQNFWSPQAHRNASEEFAMTFAAGWITSPHFIPFYFSFSSLNRHNHLLRFLNLASPVSTYSLCLSFAQYGNLLPSLSS